MASNAEVAVDPLRLWAELMADHADQLQTLRELFARRRAAGVHHRHALEQIWRALRDDAEADVSTFPPGRGLHADVAVNPELRADLHLDVELVARNEACQQYMAGLVDVMVAWLRRMEADLVVVHMDVQREARWRTWLARRLCALDVAPTGRGTA